MLTRSSNSANQKVFLILRKLTYQRLVLKSSHKEAFWTQDQYSDVKSIQKLEFCKSPALDVSSIWVYCFCIPAKALFVFWDRIKGLKLQHFGELNFAYHGKLRHCSRQAAVDETHLCTGMDATILTSPNETNVHCYLSMEYLRNWWH